MTLALVTLEAELQPYINQLGAVGLPQTMRAGSGVGVFTAAMVQKFSDNPASGVALPSDARHAIVVVKGGGIRVRTDQTDPTGATGLYLPAGTLLFFKNQRQLLEQWRFVDSAGETAEVSCMWFA